MGFEEITVGVDKDNSAAMHLYEKYGFTNVLFDGADENGEYLKLMKIINWYLIEKKNPVKSLDFLQDFC